MRSRWCCRIPSSGRVFALGVVLLGALVAARAADFVCNNGIPPRVQWNANGGYCGEVSFISAGLYFGQYMSQFEARVCAIGRQLQDEGELLLGDNDRRAARTMRLRFEEWDGSRQKNAAQFLQWVKSHVLVGHPVIIGVYNNEYRLYGNTDPDAGDPQYDHIVPVMRVASRHPFSAGGYFANDRLTFSDNGLWGPTRKRPFYFTYSFGTFPGTRQQANAPDGPIYMLPSDGRNYGIAITGVADVGRDTVPVRVDTSRNNERPRMQPHSNRRPPSRPLRLTVTASGLQPNTAYRLYRYDRQTKIPVAAFNAHASAASRVWNITAASGGTFSIRERIRSDQVAAYRCVRADAP